MNKTKTSLLSLGLGALLFLAINVFASKTLKRVRLDLTEDSLFTLSEGARSVARKVDEPVHLYFYFSSKPAGSIPSLKSYAQRVREMLEEFVLASEGMLELRVIEPEPFSEAEDEAVAAGLQPLRFRQAADPIYFGLVATGSTDERESIPFFEPQKERFLEYDVARLVHMVSQPNKRVIGLLSPLPLGGDPMAAMMGQQGPPPWQIHSEVDAQFELRTLTPDLSEVPADVDALWLVHPKGLSDGARYAIDQFVLGGGPALVMLDPLCEREDVQSDPSNPMAAAMADRSSNLPQLLAAWGAEMVDASIVGDRENAEMASMQGPGGVEQARYVAWIQLDSSAMDADDASVSQLDDVLVSTAGRLKPFAGSAVEFAPLMQTSTDSMELDKMRLQFGARPQELLADFVASGERYALAARLTGQGSSAFPEGAPAAPVIEGEEPAPPAPGEHLAQGAINVTVVADCDLLSDQWWIQRSFFGPMKMRDNGDLVLNLLDNLCGGSDLVSIRGRGRYTRPFDHVDEIRTDAEARYQREEEELNQELASFEERIQQLQGEQGDSQRVFLSEADLEELENLRESQVETRKQLRDVQHNLRKDIELLGTRIKWMNIVAYPLGVGAAFALLGAARMRRRRR